MQERPKAMIAGFGCKPLSLNYLRLLSADITEGRTIKLPFAAPYVAILGCV